MKRFAEKLNQKYFLLILVILLILSLEILGILLFIFLHLEGSFINQCAIFKILSVISMGLESGIIRISYMRRLGLSVTIINIYLVFILRFCPQSFLIIVCLRYNFIRHCVLFLFH